MNNLVITGADGVAVVSSLSIAEGTDNQHKNVLELIRGNLADLEEFGRVAFQTRPLETAGGTQQREVALLNEPQSALLITYMRNNDVVRDFKKKLVKAFYELRAQSSLSPFDAQALAALYQESLQRSIRRLADKAAKELMQQAQNLQSGAHAPARKPAALPNSAPNQAEIRAFIKNMVTTMMVIDDEAADGKSFGELIRIAATEPDYTGGADMKPNAAKAAAVTALAGLGMRVAYAGRRPMLEITTTYGEFHDFVLSCSPWRGTKYRNILKAIPGAYPGDGNRYFAKGINTPFVAVPIEALLAEAEPGE